MKSSIHVFLLLQLIVSINALAKPRNTLTKVGQPTVLTCCSGERNTELYWLFKKWDTDKDPNRICDRQVCTEKYSADKNDTCLNLVIHSTTHEHAGLYQCVQVGGKTNGAYLAAYDYFTCSLNADKYDDFVEGESALFRCSILWIGKLPFEFQWTTDKIISSAVFSKAHKDHIYTASLKVAVERPELPSHTATVVLVNEGVMDENIDTHTPFTNWTSPSFLVKYPVSNIRTSCAKDSDCRTNFDDSIECSADGHPTPNFRWYNWDEKLVSYGAMLHVNFSRSQKFHCVATNSIRGVEYKQRKFAAVKVHVEKEATVNAAVALVVVALILVVVILSSVFYISRIAKEILKVHKEKQQ